MKLESKFKELLNRLISKDTYNVSPTAIIKSKVLLNKSEGKSISEISNEVGISKRMVSYYIKDYLKCNSYTEQLTFIHKKRKYKTSELEPFKTNIKEEFKINRPKTYKDATNIINKLFNLNLSESAVRRFLIKNKIKLKKKRK